MRDSKTIDIDIAGLMALRHRCAGCRDPETCCCASYDVCVSANEVGKIESLLPHAAKYCGHLARGDGYDNVFDPVGAGLCGIDTDEDGLCVFAYRRAGAIRCSLHSAALDLGMALADAKPASCLLWPLVVTAAPDRILSVHEEALLFPCNRRRARGPAALHAGVAEVVETVFGEETRKRIDKAAHDGLARATLPLRGPLAPVL